MAETISVSNGNTLYFDKAEAMPEVTNIDVFDIHDYHKHTFKVKHDGKMERLIESVRHFGVVTPILVRKSKYPKYEKTYELISGHRRRFAAEKAGLATIPAFVLDMDDDTADIMMVDTNNQREEFSITEKALSYRLKYEAILRSPERYRGRASALLAGESEDSETQIKRFIRLTYLIKALLTCVESKVITLRTGVEASYLSRSSQETLFDIIAADGVKPNEEEIKALRELEASGDYNVDTARKILLHTEEKLMKSKLAKGSKFYSFPENFVADDTEKGELIQKLLNEYFSESVCLMAENT